jgi:hypothetical protein
MARPQIYGVGTKAQFRRAVPKSFSYRYEIASRASSDGAPEVRSIIETRYRGRAATWTLSRSVVMPEKWTLRGAYLAPNPENPLTYPETQQPFTVEAPPPEVTEAAKTALLARAAQRLAPAAPTAPPAAAEAAPTPVAPAAPAPAAPRTGPTTERVVTFGRPGTATTSRKAG